MPRQSFTPNYVLLGGRLLASFSALAASFMTRVYRYYDIRKEIGQNAYLAAAHLELGLTVGVLLDLNHYQLAAPREFAYEKRPFFWSYR